MRQRVSFWCLVCKSNWTAEVAHWRARVYCMYSVYWVLLC
jgi:hypothetical protein